MTASGRNEGIDDNRLDPMAKPSPSRCLEDFHAHVIVDQEVRYTIVGGRFSPTARIDLTSQLVILSVTAANDFRLTLPVGSFRKTGLDGYIASVQHGLLKTDILLQPLSSGDWAYSFGVDGFVPGSTPITVDLRIGSQAGRTTVNAYAF